MRTEAEIEAQITFFRELEAYCSLINDRDTVEAARIAIDWLRWSLGATVEELLHEDLNR